MNPLALLRAERLLALGQQQAAAGAPDRARETLERARALAPADHGPPLHLALLAAGQGDAAGGLEILDAAKATFGREEPVYGLFRGQLLLAAGRPAEAEAALTEAAALAPENRLIAAYRELARIAQGQLKAPLEALEKAMPENFAFQRALCLALERRLYLDGDPDEPPVEQTREASDGDAPPPPEPPPPYDAPATDAGAWTRFIGRRRFARAKSAGLAEDHARAATLFREAAERLPDDMEVAAFYAEALYHTGDLDGCRRLLLWRMAELERRGDEDLEYGVPALGYIGRTYYHQRALAHARAWYERAAKVEKDQNAAGNAGLPWCDNLYFLAMLEQREGRTAEAAEMLRTIERVEPALYHQRLRRLFEAAREETTDA